MWLNWLKQLSVWDLVSTCRMIREITHTGGQFEAECDATKIMISGE